MSEKRIKPGTGEMMITESKNRSNASPAPLPTARKKFMQAPRPHQ
jgi:hypothetical protein